MGKEVQITGVAKPVSSSQVQDQGIPGAALIGIQFWGFEGPPERVSAETIRKAVPVTLEALITRPGARDGQIVRVVGKFRGRNLYGDLPSRSQRERGDWVIKEEAFAVWVTGRKPKGKGFDLDASLKRDTGKWIQVVGRPKTIGGMTYLLALEVTLGKAPSATADALPPPPPPERPKLPPVIVFALPLDGEDEVPPDSRFVVQFSKDMDEDSFAGHVLLRYAGPVRPGDQPFNSVKVTYDRGRRALTVDPGLALAPGRQVELVLLPGIADSEGISLTGRTITPAGVTDLLHFQIGT
jgi:hypothetical protein